VLCGEKINGDDGLWDLGEKEAREWSEEEMIDVG